MKKIGTIIVGLVMFQVLLVSGCKKIAEKATEKVIETGIAKESGGKANVDLSGGKVTIETKDGTATYSGGSGSKLPDNFPKDVHVHEGATILAAVSAPGGFTVNMESADASDKILGGIKSKMSGFGWKEEATISQEKNFMITYKKGERAASFNVDSHQTKTMLTIIVTTGK